MTSKSLKSLTDQSLIACFRKRKRRARISQKKKNAFFIARGAGCLAICGNHALFNCCKNNVKRRREYASTRVNGSSFYWFRQSLSFTTSPLLFVKYFAGVRIVRFGKLHVTEHVGKTHVKKHQRVFYEGIWDIFLAILCVFLPSRDSKARYWKDERRTRLNKRGDWNPGLFFHILVWNKNRFHRIFLDH